MEHYWWKMGQATP